MHIKSKRRHEITSCMGWFILSSFMYVCDCVYQTWTFIMSCVVKLSYTTRDAKQPFIYHMLASTWNATNNYTCVARAHLLLAEKNEKKKKGFPRVWPVGLKSGWPAGAWSSPGAFLIDSREELDETPRSRASHEAACLRLPRTRSRSPSSCPRARLDVAGAPRSRHESRVVSPSLLCFPPSSSDRGRGF